MSQLLDEFNDMGNMGHSTDMKRLDHIPTTLRNLPSKMPLTAVMFRKRESLPPEYNPGEFDVCCGRGKRHWNHIGNVRFRKIIQSNVERYIAAPSKNDKTAVVVSIVADIRQLGGCFLKEDLRGMWYDIGDQQAREKVGHSLRDQVSTIHRQQQKQEAVQQVKAVVTNNINNPNPITPGASPIPNHYEETVMETSNNMDPLPYEIPEAEYNDGEDDDAQSDGNNERHARRGTLSSSLILDKFARRPSFVSFHAGAGSSGTSSGGMNNTTSLSSSASKRSVRSSGWSFLNDLDFNTDLLDGDFNDNGTLEPIAYKSGSMASFGL